jgi:hypothetical protein
VQGRLRRTTAATSPVRLRKALEEAQQLPHIPETDVEDRSKVEEENSRNYPDSC